MRTLLKTSGLGLAGLALAATLAACGGEETATSLPADPTTLPASGSPSTAASESPNESPSAASSQSPTGATAPSGRTVKCEYPTDPMGAVKQVNPPSTNAPSRGTVSVTLQTSQGDIPLTLDRRNAPCAVNSFVSLSEQGYYDGSSCHRMSNQPPYQFLQCGDPQTDPALQGTGGPGYTFPDELKGNETYQRGTIAMANAGADTNGSQFFLVYGDSPFPPDYVVFGTIAEPGLQVLEKIGSGGLQPGTERPVTNVTITKSAVN